MLPIYLIGTIFFGVMLLMLIKTKDRIAHSTEKSIRSDSVKDLNIAATSQRNTITMTLLFSFFLGSLVAELLVNKTVRYSILIHIVIVITFMIIFFLAVNNISRQLKYK